MSLEDGRLLWESRRLVPRRDDHVSAELQEGSVIVSSTSSVSAVDSVTGLTLWQGTTPRHPRFVACILTQSYAVTLHVPGPLREGDSVAYFYDHRSAGGDVLRNGEAVKLGRLSDVRAVMAVDGALLIQTGSTIQGWKHE
jgi:hypothetical protein